MSLELWVWNYSSVGLFFSLSLLTNIHCTRIRHFSLAVSSYGMYSLSTRFFLLTLQRRIHLSSGIYSLSSLFAAGVKNVTRTITSKGEDHVGGDIDHPNSTERIKAQELQYLQRQRHHLGKVSADAFGRHMVVKLREEDIRETFARGGGPGEQSAVIFISSSSKFHLCLFIPSPFNNVFAIAVLIYRVLLPLQGARASTRRRITYSCSTFRPG